MNSSKDIHKKVRDGYFPYTNKCHCDGNPCWGEKCKFFIGPKRCWNREFKNLVHKDIFKGHDNEYMRFEGEKGNFYSGFDYVYVNMPHGTYGDDFRETGKIVVVIWIQFSSLRLAEIIQREFGLKDWIIEGHNGEGGDDHVIQIEIPATYDKKTQVIQFLKDLKAMIPDIIKFEKGANTCHACGEHSDALEEYEPAGGSKIAICYRCERKIISEHVREYIKQ